jgi:biotin synthase-related radical SAM superfamily protein
MPIEASERVLNGYFYTFIYKAADTSSTVDEVPLIYCIGPSLKSPNCFVGLNLHHLPESAREILIRKMEAAKKVVSSGSRALFTDTELNTMVPGAKAAIREYNRKRIYRCYRIDSKEIPLYIYGDGQKRTVVDKSKLDIILRKIGINKQTT